MHQFQTLSAVVSSGSVVQRHRSWQRILVNADAWRVAAKFLSQPQCTLAGLWGDSGSVHMAILDEFSYNLNILTLGCEGDKFPSVAKLHPPAIRLERAIADLFGYEPLKPSDSRPWLDHGRWGVRHPLGGNSASETAEPYAFLNASGEGIHQIAVGPVHAGIIEPGHFRFHANGEAVVRLEARLGYAHKGIDGLMQGATLEEAGRLAGRVSGDSTVAYATAFAMAAEDALGIAPPPRAQWLRALMMELERLANHYGDIGAICNDASFSLMQAHCAVLRERVLRVSDLCFGHRMMRDAVFAGGAREASVDGLSALRALLPELEKRFAAIVTVYEETASIQDRTVSTGVLKPELAKQFGAGGFVGRASGRSFDARRALRYPPYDGLEFEVPVLEEGDVNARVWIRIHEVKQSISLVKQILRQLPSGPARVDLVRGAGEGLAMVEGFRGDILAWLRIDADGRIARCHLRDPSWFQWPLLEAAIEGNIVADFPICNKSFNCSYSGHDL
ncbi:MAG: hydrogenase expression protein HypE [Pseudomonadota bacterium]